MSHAKVMARLRTISNSVSGVKGTFVAMQVVLVVGVVVILALRAN
jgi:hypothetical protein